MARSRIQTLLGALAIASIVLATGGASAGAHTPATFKFANTNSENSKIATKPDGSGSTAHHVIFIPSFGEITCASAEFLGTVDKLTTTGIKISGAFYASCKALTGGEAMTFSIGSCELTFTASGEMVIASRPGENCPTNPMTFTSAGGCVISIPEQTVSGLGYTNINSGGLEEVTMSMSLTNIIGTRGGKCASPGNFVGGAYKTGNTIIGALEDPGAGGAVSLKWLATVP